MLNLSTGVKWSFDRKIGKSEFSTRHFSLLIRHSYIIFPRIEKKLYVNLFMLPHNIRWLFSIFFYLSRIHFNFHKKKRVKFFMPYFIHKDTIAKYKSWTRWSSKVAATTRYIYFVKDEQLQCSIFLRFQLIFCDFLIFVISFFFVKWKIFRKPKLENCCHVKI